jgi:exodeoxyribonuclease-3
MKRIITTNVNGIRAAEKKGFFDWIKTQDADVVCLQEIKAQEDQLDERFYPKEYHCYYQSAEKKGYSGTAIFSKQAPTKIIKESPWDDINFEGRFIQADFKDFSVISMVFIQSKKPFFSAARMPLTLVVIILFIRIIL